MRRSWSEILGITTPELEKVKGHSEANTYVLLLVALLERGAPMTLEEVAGRFEAAGVEASGQALGSLKRCKPARPPVYRVGDRYCLDPYDEDLSLWVFRLGLRPPKVAAAPRPRTEPPPLPGPEVALSRAELDQGWRDASLRSWSAKRLTLAVLDANGGPMTPREVVDAVGSRTRWHSLSLDCGIAFQRKNSTVDVLPDGRWAIGARAGRDLEATRKALRKRIEGSRQHPAPMDPEDLARRQRAAARQRAERARALAGLKRALLYAYPAVQPAGVALLDVGAATISTFIGQELQGLGEALAAYDLIAAMEVRALLEGLGLDFDRWRLHELVPHQKTARLASGRRVTLSLPHLIQSCCGISDAFGDEEKLGRWLAEGKEGYARRRLTGSASALGALYHYGRLQRALRPRPGGTGERIPIAWSDRDEPGLGELKRAALQRGLPLEVVLGPAPALDAPWAAARRVNVVTGPRGWHTWLLDEERRDVEDGDVQRARLPGGAALHPQGGHLEIEVHLLEIEPRIWRRFLVGADATFSGLHQAIQDAFGWKNYHLWEFRSADRAIAGLPLDDDWGEPAPDGAEVRVADHLKAPGDRCRYLYDFGDDWHHEVRLIRRVEDGPPAFRELLAGERACPPEDCGGLSGYERVAEFVRTGIDPWDDNDDGGLRDWLGGWRPDRFELEVARVRF
jgi:hypothetical protein